MLILAHKYTGRYINKWDCVGKENNQFFIYYLIIYFKSFYQTFLNSDSFISIDKILFKEGYF